MAAAMRLSPKTIFASLAKCQLRAYSASPKTALGGRSVVEKVVTTSDNSTFVAYHPSRDFPYEMSRPLPPPAIPTSMLIKEESIKASTAAFNKKHPDLVVQELSRITFTTKHRWFPRARDRRAKKTPMDRQYL